MYHSTTEPLLKDAILVVWEHPHSGPLAPVKADTHCKALSAVIYPQRQQNIL